MKEAEPNRKISRRELLKSIGRGSLIVSGIGLAGVSGIDFYSIEKNERQRTNEAEKEAESKGITKPDKKALKTAKQILKEIKENPLTNRRQEEIQQAKRIQAEQDMYDNAVFRIDWIDNLKPHTPLRTKIRDIWGIAIGAALTAIGGGMVWDARQYVTQHKIKK
jgi:hypothetical protein